MLILYRPATKQDIERTIKFKRISHSFNPNYLFPNPIYYFTRIKTLVGNYSLTDSLNNVVSSNFRIDIDGKTTGYLPFKNKLFYFSTDIYCGPESAEDFVLICHYNEKLEPNCKGFIYKKVDDNTIQFHESEWVTTAEGYEKQKVGKMIYKLTKK